MAAKLLFIVFIVCSDAIAYELTKVVILSRHNVRAPLQGNLGKVTPKTWPKWREDLGHLTAKGELLESYMGEYFSQWLKQEGLFNKTCPEEDAVYIYANSLQRTRETARMFTKSAFKNCNFKVNIKNVTNDPVFRPLIGEDIDKFKSVVVKEMQKKLDGLQLKEAYLYLNKILSINESRACKETSLCDLTVAKDTIVLKIGEEPDINGPLYIGNAVVDNFLMSYYSGWPLKSIGWGEIEPDMWESLTKIIKGNQNVRFNNTILAQDIARPLLQVMHDVFTNESLKFTLLVGHDSNINTILPAIGFKPFNLPNQHENSPIGGKLVFQKFYDKILDRNLLKINYVYQSTEQLRNGTKLSLENPPESVTLELQNCKRKDCGTDKNDLCLWEDLVKILDKLK